jgi:putative membrane protein
MMWGYDMTGMGWWMIASSLIWFALVAIAVWAFARWAARQPAATVPGSANVGTPGPSAMEILRQRFARGEIDGDTFQRMRQQLEAAPGQQPPRL